MRRMPAYDPDHPNRQILDRVRYSHDAMVDLIIQRPEIHQNEIAEIFGRRPHWVSLVINSDAFQSRLAERKKELVDPILQATINDRLQAVAAESLDRIREKLSGPLPLTDEFLLKSADLSTKALGYGARVPGAGSTTNVAVVVQVPAKIASASDWAARHAPAPLVIEMPRADGAQA